MDETRDANRARGERTDGESARIASRKVAEVVRAGVWSDIGAEPRRAASVHARPAFTRRVSRDDRRWHDDDRPLATTIAGELSDVRGQMPGVNYAGSEARHSALWYTDDIDAALMGIQSTAQFVEKYHHIIGKVFTVDVEFTSVYIQSEREGEPTKSPAAAAAPVAIYFDARLSLMRRPYVKARVARQQLLGVGLASFRARVEHIYVISRNVRIMDRCFSIVRGGEGRGRVSRVS